MRTAWLVLTVALGAACDGKLTAWHADAGQPADLRDNDVDAPAPLDRGVTPTADGVKPNPDTNKPKPDAGQPKPLACAAQGGSGAVQKPVFVKNLPGTGTSWFGGAAMVDLDHDGKRELVGAFYDLIVWSAAGKQLARAKSGGQHSGRIYAPVVIADLDGDKVMELVVGAKKRVAAYQYKNKQLSIKPGWPVYAGTASQSYEVRGLAAADLDGDKQIELVASTTVGSGGSQIWVFTAAGKLYQPQGLTQHKAWPRFNKLSGPGNDADTNGMGQKGYGCYGLNVGIGDIDDDPQLEIVVTNDTHKLMAFNHDGTSLLASSWYKNRDSKYKNKRLCWSQMIRWADAKVEDDHFHLHTGKWPNVGDGQVWLQWTASPPNVVDVNGDGKNEVLAVANAESSIPYKTVYNAFMVLQGDHGKQDLSGRRLAGWTKLPRGAPPQARPAGYVPPRGIPAPTSVDLDGDKLPEAVAPSEDGRVHAVSPKGALLWSLDYRAAGKLTYASEVVVADLNRDGSPELIFSTWGAPSHKGAGRLIIANAKGQKLYDLAVPGQQTDSNGVGLPAAPAVGDLDGDGVLELALQSFDHGLDLYRVPGSGTKCLLWPVARGNLMRNGQGPAYK